MRKVVLVLSIKLSLCCFGCAAERDCPDCCPGRLIVSAIRFARATTHSEYLWSSCSLAVVEPFVPLVVGGKVPKYSSFTPIGEVPTLHLLMEEKDKTLNSEPSTLSESIPESTMGLAGKKRLLDNAQDSDSDSPAERRKCPDGATSNITPVDDGANDALPNSPVQVQESGLAAADLIDLTNSDNDEDHGQAHMTNGVRLFHCTCAEAEENSPEQQTENGSVLSEAPIELSTRWSPVLDPSRAAAATVPDGNGGMQLNASLAPDSVQGHCVCCSGLPPHMVNSYWPFNHCAVRHTLRVGDVSAHHIHHHFHEEPRMAYSLNNANYAGAPSDPSQMLGLPLPFNEAPMRYMLENSPPPDARPSCRDYSNSVRAPRTTPPASALPSSHSRSAEEQYPVFGVRNQRACLDDSSFRLNDDRRPTDQQPVRPVSQNVQPIPSDSSDDDEPAILRRSCSRQTLVHSPVPLWQQRHLEVQRDHMERRRWVESAWFNFRERLHSVSRFRLLDTSSNRSTANQRSPILTVADNGSPSRAHCSSSGNGDSSASNSRQFRSGLGNAVSVDSMLSYLGHSPSSHSNPSASFQRDIATTQSDGSVSSRSQGFRRRALNVGGGSSEGRSLLPHSSYFGPFVLLDRQSWPMEAHLLRHMAQILETPEGASMTVIESNSICSRFVPSDPVPVGEEEKCSICLGEFEGYEIIRTLRCGHFFHCAAWTLTASEEGAYPSSVGRVPPFFAHLKIRLPVSFRLTRRWASNVRLIVFPCLSSSFIPLMAQSVRNGERSFVA
uniref:RING-type domain-containing protein n=1 Tax=Trichuris muris TaxID=70415 RepID=A0A5S6Q903_TRIMR